MNSTPKISIQRRPDAESDIREIAEHLIQKAKVADVLPTPVDELITSVGVVNVRDTESFKDRFLTSLPTAARFVFEAAWDKIRGIADLRDKAVYVPKATSTARVHFAKCHELGHQVIPWQKINIAYRDDDASLRSGFITEIEELFDFEANFFAAEIIFQGKRFAKRIRDYKPSFAAAFLLADEHGASRHATLRRYVEEHDETLAIIPYWPSRYAVDEHGYPVLWANKMIASPGFIEKYSDVQLPREIWTGHDWISARDVSSVCDGTIRLGSRSGAVEFQWQSWWNNYCLFVLLRRKPALSLVGSFIRS